MIDEVQPQTPRKAALPFLVKAGLWVAGVAAAALIGLWLEYYVFNPPGDPAAQAARDERILALLRGCGVLAVAIFLLISVVSEEGRATWGRGRDALERFVRIILGLRPRFPYTSEKSRTAEAEARRTAECAKYAEGFAARSAEVTAEREDARKKPPSFSVKRTDGWHQNEFRLSNRGWMVGNVWLTAPEDEFVFDGDPPVWSGNFGSDSPGTGSGMCFYGLPTEKGFADGVNFKVEWSWRNFDRDEREVHADPKDLIRSSAGTE